LARATLAGACCGNNALGRPERYGCGSVWSGFSAVCGGISVEPGGGAAAAAVEVVAAGGLAVGTGGVVFLAATFFGAAAVVVALGVSGMVVVATTGLGG
jgi:hypothetical protein